MIKEGKKIERKEKRIKEIIFLFSTFKSTTPPVGPPCQGFV